MLERWRKALDKNSEAEAILADLAKAFDCINHELLIAKLNIYGFVHDSLTYIYRYISERKQRTKINNSFSSWSSAARIYSFFYRGALFHYAHYNTPYAMQPNIEGPIGTSKINTYYINVVG